MSKYTALPRKVMLGKANDRRQILAPGMLSDAIPPDLCTGCDHQSIDATGKPCHTRMILQSVHAQDVLTALGETNSLAGIKLNLSDTGEATHCHAHMILPTPTYASATPLTASCRFSPIIPHYAHVTLVQRAITQLVLLMTVNGYRYF